MSEADYERVTYGITIAAATTLARLNKSMTFIYVSGAGTDSSERGRIMWARVKGRTENALLRLPFKAAYMFRPGVIQPLHGIKSKTAAYRILYSITEPLLPVLRRLMPGLILTTEQIGRAMLTAARALDAVLESRDISPAPIGSDLGGTVIRRLSANTTASPTQVQHAGQHDGHAVRHHRCQARGGHQQGMVVRFPAAGRAVCRREARKQRNRMDFDRPIAPRPAGATRLCDAIETAANVAGK